MVLRNSLAFAVLLICCVACSPQAGYEVLQQVEYQQCLRNSPHPAEDCRFGPDYDSYNRQRRERLSGDEAAD